MRRRGFTTGGELSIQAHVAVSEDWLKSFLKVKYYGVIEYTVVGNSDQIMS